MKLNKYVFLVPVIALGLAIGVQSCNKKPEGKVPGIPTTYFEAIGPRAVPNTYIYTVGGSMGNRLPSGSLVFIEEIKSLDAIQLRQAETPGDIIVVRWEGRGVNVAHEALTARYDRDGKIVGIVTKGAANAERDPIICTLADLIGRVQIQ